MCRITSVSGRSADQPRVLFRRGSPCQQHQRFFSCASFMCGYEENACLISSFFFFLRAALVKNNNSETRAHMQGAVRFPLVGRTHLDNVQGCCVGRGQMVLADQQIWLPCFQVLRTCSGCGLLLCRLDRSDQVAQLENLATCARADWLLHIGGVELMQVGTVRMAQHRVALTGPRHSGDNDDQAFLLSDCRDANLCCRSELSVRSLLSMLHCVASCESRFLHGAVLCMFFLIVVV